MHGARKTNKNRKQGASENTSARVGVRERSDCSPAPHTLPLLELSNKSGCGKTQPARFEHAATTFLAASLPACLSSSRKLAFTAFTFLCTTLAALFCIPVFGPESVHLHLCSWVHCQSVFAAWFLTLANRCSLFFPRVIFLCCHMALMCLLK